MPFVMELQTLSVWQPNLACTSYVYEQINEIGVQALFAMDPTIFQTSMSNLFIPNAHNPVSQRLLSAPGHASRACITQPHVAWKLKRFQGLLTGQEMDSDVYNTLWLMTCERGPYDVVRNLFTN